MSHPDRSIGQVCYEAYRAQVAPYKGHELRAWAALHPASRTRWENAALAVHGLEVVAVLRPKVMP